MANSVWLELAKRVGLQLATAGSWWTRNCAHDGARVLPWKPQALRPLGFGCECQSTVDFECRWLQKVVNSWAGQLLSSFGFIVKRCKKSKSQGDKLFWDAKLAVLQQCQGRSPPQSFEVNDWLALVLAPMRWQISSILVQARGMNDGWCWDVGIAMCIIGDWHLVSSANLVAVTFLLTNFYPNMLTDFEPAIQPNQQQLGDFEHFPNPRHTIYHIHAPVKLEDGRGMYLPALEALGEFFLSPKKERSPSKMKTWSWCFLLLWESLDKSYHPYPTERVVPYPFFLRPCMRSPLPLKCYPIALRRSVRQGEYVESSLTLDMLNLECSQAVLAEMQQVNAAWLVSDVSRNRMHEGELQWSALAVDLPKMMNLHEQKIQKVARNLIPVTSAWGHGISYRNMDLERFAWDQQTWIVPWRKCLCFGGGRPGAALFEDAWS